MTIAQDIMHRLYGKPLPAEKQTLLAKLTERVNRDRQQKAKQRSTIIPHDAAAYMDAHNIPLPKE
jgi:hypothetical protein